MLFDTRIAATLGASLLALHTYATWTRKKMTTESTTAAQGPYEPSVADVLVTKAMLCKALRLPPEIVDTIVDHAEYWPHTTTRVDYPNDSLIARGKNNFGNRSATENVFLLRSPPLGLHNWNRVSRGMGDTPIHRTVPKPRPPGQEFLVDDFQELVASPISLLAHPCRRIVFTIRSHDQGWGGAPGDHGTYNGSWTWFEAGLERWCRSSPSQISSAGGQPPQQPDHGPSLKLDDLCTVYPEVEWQSEAQAYVFKHDLLAREEYKVQCNITAQRETQTHCVVWSYTDDIDPERDPEAATRLAEQGRGKATGNGKFVRDLKLGDIVTLWAKARFPGWANHVESVRMDVYYAV
ncbi:hypothetical protein MYCTH_2297284 [Thermothelomyces thermophilus ATCC 42464]|uniref:Uncharacterized protein n=1 Tax=Thermothelomyces thermophilus (strain ATCC 42464 / BCRC 31852 / DSM 1799) TaxID=573729 RepID=G2Q540_THET4|nr:uncharacterized protein MYCTH_2297284 [Thermothelomyces thermophilus ATCC 42464]AEO54578.1 hypothetical protein MYCTH_2297284 [Thermothelomyces thermophilus ATCC 42464]